MTEGNKDKILLYYKRNFLNVQLVIGTVSIFLILLVLTYLIPSTTINNWVLSIKENLYPVIASVSGALLGFVITGVSVIIVFTESDKLKLLRKTDTYKDVFKVYFRAIYYLALTTGISAIGIVIPKFDTFCFYLLLWSLLISTLGLYNCIWVLENLVEVLTKKK